MNAVSDVLGEEGRMVGDACVKVKIIGEPEDYARKKYTWNDALKRLERCYAGRSPANFVGDLLLPREYDDKGNVNREKTYNILDIHNALENFDEKPFVEKYPRPGTGRDELEKLIDKRRADVEKEHAEAMADPNSRREYSWLVAQRRVRDCFAGNFAGDSPPFGFNSRYKKNVTYNIFDICKAVVFLKESDISPLCRKGIPLPSGPGSDELKMSIQKNNFDLEEEKKEAQTRIKQYSKDEAVKRVKDCFPLNHTYLDENVALFQNSGNGETYDIFHIYKEVERLKLYRCLQRNDSMCKSVTKEYEAALKELGRYPQDEAWRRVRDCLNPGYYWLDTDIFPDKIKDERVRKTEQTYDISDIKNSIEYFDKRKFLDKYLPENNKYPDARERNEKVKEEREKIIEEYVKATEKGEISHGSGFIINDHYIITNKHVIDDADGKEIVISNASISELPCEVVYTDGGKDLVLLYCQELDIKQNQVVPLHLSNQPLVTGMQVFSFGYPMSHTGETALFINGHVSGFTKPYADNRPSLAVLNLSLNSGNSGGPILHWIVNQLKVVGVATQKHFKEILTFEERDKIEKIRKSMETNDISNISEENITHFSRLSPGGELDIEPDPRPSLWGKLDIEHDPRQIPMNLLTLKLYDALETHSQFNLSNALPGDNVIKFIEEAIKKCSREHKDELVEVVKRASDHNILPSGQHSVSDCCIQ